jgi:hypothetical protein
MLYPLKDIEALNYTPIFTHSYLMLFTNNDIIREVIVLVFRKNVW